MEIEIQNAIGLFFPNPNFQQVYFEAVVNALDAGATKIHIEIKLRSFSNPETLKIIVSDNGEGFSDDRFSRFCKLLKPEDAYHKGLGRLVFLRYFNQVEVESCFDSSVRTFTFTSSFSGKNEKKPVVKQSERETKLSFKGFAGRSLKSYDDVRPESVLERLKLEILPRLYEMKKADQELEIVVNLEAQESKPEYEFYSNTRTFKLDKLPELTEVTIKDPAIDLYDTVSMAYRIENRFGKSSVVTAACVDGRTISLDLIPPEGIPNNYSVIFLFNSKLFKADSSRQCLDLKDDALERILFKVLRKHVAEVISDKIPAVKDKNQATRDRFLDRYPHLIGYFEEETVGLIQRDEALEIAQKKFFKDQKEILEATTLDDDQYQKSLAAR